MTKTSNAQVVHDFLINLSKLIKDPTIPSQQVLLLTSLYLHGEVNQSELEELTSVKRSSNSRNVLKLGPGEHAWSTDGPGLVESFEDKMNRRLKRVRLTEKGRVVMEKALSKAIDQERQPA
jgi:DNA-binding MarR family transcriptional regulator